jgi:hypothetical protein
VRCVHGAAGVALYPRWGCTASDLPNTFPLGRQAVARRQDRSAYRTDLRSPNKPLGLRRGRRGRPWPRVGCGRPGPLGLCFPVRPLQHEPAGPSVVVRAGAGPLQAPLSPLIMGRVGRDRPARQTGPGTHGALTFACRTGRSGGPVISPGAALSRAASPCGPATPGTTFLPPEWRPATWPRSSQPPRTCGAGIARRSRGSGSAAPSTSWGASSTARGTTSPGTTTQGRRGPALRLGSCPPDGGALNLGCARRHAAGRAPAAAVRAPRPRRGGQALPARERRGRRPGWRRGSAHRCAGGTAPLSGRPLAPRPRAVRPPARIGRRGQLLNDYARRQAGGTGRGSSGSPRASRRGRCWAG